MQWAAYTAQFKLARMGRSAYYVTYTAKFIKVSIILAHKKLS
jgi:hypothetical protein